MTRWQIPEALPVDWQMRAPGTASITVGYLEDGRFRQRVEHAPCPVSRPPCACDTWNLPAASSPWQGHTALAYRFCAGLCWAVEMTVGSLEPGLRTIVRALVRRRMAFLQRWRQHNVEEAGNLPYFLPELYTRDAGS